MNAPLRERKANIWARDPFDWYVEEPYASDLLFSVEKFVGTIWDPACGQGNILQSALTHGYRVVGTDIVKRVDCYWFRAEIDFPFFSGQALAQNLVFNSPFYRGKGTEVFIRKALTLASGKVAAFTDLKFLSGAGRASGLYAEHPPMRIYMITPRPSCPPGEYLKAGNKAEGGTADWVWLVWDLTAPKGDTRFIWLRRSDEAGKFDGVAA
jgi:hypothetical protein